MKHRLQNITKRFRRYFGMGSALQETPCFSFGIAADIQYADLDDGYNYSRTNKRYYRQAVDMLNMAITAWNTDSHMKPSFILQLGDIIDGYNKRHGISETSLETVLNVMLKFKEPIYHIWGNHEFYNFSRDYLLKSKLFSGNQKHCTAVPDKGYYSCIPHPKLRVIALDCYEISLLGSVEGSEEHKKAEECLQVNKNEDKNSGLNLEGEERRFVRFNGAIGPTQLEWMRTELAAAKSLRQNVIVMGHCAVYAKASSVECLCWDAPEIMELLHTYSDTVLCYLSGHDHSGGQATDSAGIVHMTLPAMLENNTESDFGTVYVYTDRMVMVGNGRVPNLTLPLRYQLDLEKS